MVSGEMTRMTIRVKLRDGAADGGFTNILSKPLNLKCLGSVLEERGLVNVDVDAYERLVEKRSARLQRMSLGELLYYVLLGEGMIADEPA
ncbi:MAG: hypothetical protein WB439_16370 [Acidobacteriaceae bacterium]